MTTRARDNAYIRCNCRRYFESSLKEKKVFCSICGASGTTEVLLDAYENRRDRVKFQDEVAVRNIMNFKKFSKKYPNLKQLAEKIANTEKLKKSVENSLDK